VFALENPPNPLYKGEPNAFCLFKGKLGALYVSKKECYFPLVKGVRGILQRYS
jgi:hypothetical protein